MSWSFWSWPLILERGGVIWEIRLLGRGVCVPFPMCCFWKIDSVPINIPRVPTPIWNCSSIINFTTIDIYLFIHSILLNPNYVQKETIYFYFFSIQTMLRKEKLRVNVCYDSRLEQILGRKYLSFVQICWAEFQSVFHHTFNSSYIHIYYYSIGVVIQYFVLNFQVSNIFWMLCPPC